MDRDYKYKDPRLMAARDAFEQAEFVRHVLAEEVDSRALTNRAIAVAARIRALPLDDPRLLRLAAGGHDPCFDIMTAEELAAVLAPFMEAGDPPLAT